MSTKDKAIKKIENKLFAYISILATIIAYDSYMTYQKHEKFTETINSMIPIISRYSADCRLYSQQAEISLSDIIYKHVKPKFDILRKNIDKKSCEVINYVEKAICYGKARRFTHFEDLNIKFPDYDQQHKQKWEEQTKMETKYNLDGETMAPEIFYFHHGLRFANSKIKNYIKNKDILDCGAFVGDSVLVLKDYTDKTIYCYEFYEPCIKKFHKIMKLNNITSGYNLIPLALGESTKNANIQDELLIVCKPQHNSSNSTNKNTTISTIDEEAKRLNFNVGFIKADVEGHGFKLIKGAINTIKKQRPVLSLAIYHNQEELFEIKPFLEKHLNNYVFEFHLQQFDESDINELILFCYPKELR